MRVVRFFSCAICTSVLIGCETPSPTTSNEAMLETNEVVSDEPVVWPYWPTNVRVHPLTRITDDPLSRAFVLEARVEFSDSLGDTTKCSGRIQLDLIDEGQRGRPESSMQTWNVDLRDAKTNRSHFDDVTRTYVFKLGLEREQVPNTPVLRVLYLGADGAELRDRADVRRR